MDPRPLIQALGSKDGRLEAIRALLGGITATELRRIAIGDVVLDALVDGLHEPNPQIRWWCVQLLDHIPDRRTLLGLAGALDDPIPRVRRNAAHALGCTTCKPDWDGSLPPEAIAKLHAMATTDLNAKVRAEAAFALRSQQV